MIKAAFFDIDGTLRPYEEEELRESTINMLRSLQGKGIRVYIATGRPYTQFPLLGKRLNEFEWDGYLLLNGQYCLDENRKCFYKLPIPEKTLRQLVPWLKKNVNYPCVFNEAELSYDAWDHTLTAEDRKNPYMLDHMDPERSYTHETFQICPYIPASQDAEWLTHAPQMESARWASDFADMIPQGGGKPTGIRHMLERIGCTQEECIAFGDGGNDISMLEYAHIGVAMGNANDEVKKHADYVTDDSNRDGILKALRHFGIL